MLVLVLLIFCGLFGSSVVGVDEGKSQCGYKGCPVLPESSKGKKIIHLICHTHDDVGWVKSADQYFFGGRRDQNYFAVEQILDSVVSELLKNKNRRFVYVESAFLWRWWLLKEQSVREVFWKLVDEGRLQLLGGGWVMSDEATTHYSALIDQMTLGHKFLKNTFGECNLPRVAWQIDPFGHSSEVALEFAEMGFDGLFFSRMDYVEYSKRKANKSLEMIWQPDTREGANGDLFTGQTYDPLNPYHPPKGLNFDITSRDEPVIDNKLFHGYNVERRAKDLMNAANEYSKVYKTKNVMLTMGGDFHYMVASSWFNNLDRLIKYINKNSKEMYVIYSTPACYLKSLHESNTVWPVKADDDFFPYGGTTTEIWTGYYTSRPSFKNLAYRANNFYQACKQLRFPLNESYEMEQFNMARAMGMAQHHDAVTGTEKSFVADDYAQYIEEGLAGCEKIAAATLSEWDTNNDRHKLSYQFCQKLNIAECIVSEKNSNFFVTVYNPQAHYKNHTVILPVNLDTYKVTDSNASEIEFDLFPLPNEIRAIPGRKNFANSPQEMVFNVINLPPLGTKSFLVENIKKQTPEVIQIQEYTLGQLKPITAVNGDIKLDFDPASGLLVSITRKNEKWEFSQNFFSYDAGYSGAYLFFASSDAQPLTTKIDSISVAVGKNVVEVRQKFTPFVSQIIRLYKGKDEIEFNWLVGPIPGAQQIITRYSTSKLTSSAAFYTDSNGRRFIKRERENSIEKSYYPITAAAQLKDTTHKVTVLTDRPQGAASLRNGELEIMLHRRLQRDDGKGVEEILDEIEYQVGLVIRGKHIVQLSKLNESSTPDDSKNSAAYKHRIGAQDMVFTPIISFAKATSSAIEHFKNDTNDMDYTGIMKIPLPDNIHLLTLERWDNSTVLVRLEHLFEPDEDLTYSKPTTVKLKELFSGYDITTATEYSLAGTFEKTKMERLKWKNEKDPEDEREKKDEKTEPLPSSLEVILKPMQIRTFQLNYQLVNNLSCMSSLKKTLIKNSI